MEKHIFYAKYANLPIEKREQVVLVEQFGGNRDELTLNEVYQEIKQIDDKLLHDEIRRKRLLKAVEKL